MDIAVGGGGGGDMIPTVHFSYQASSSFWSIFSACGWLLLLNGAGGPLLAPEDDPLRRNSQPETENVDQNEQGPFFLLQVSSKWAFLLIQSHIIHLSQSGGGVFWRTRGTDGVQRMRRTRGTDEGHRIRGRMLRGRRCFSKSKVYQALTACWNQKTNSQ